MTSVPTPTATKSWLRSHHLRVSIRTTKQRCASSGTNWHPAPVVMATSASLYTMKTSTPLRPKSRILTCSLSNQIWLQEFNQMTSRSVLDQRTATSRRICKLICCNVVACHLRDTLKLLFQNSKLTCQSMPELKHVSQSTRSTQTWWSILSLIFNRRASLQTQMTVRSAQVII